MYLRRLLTISVLIVATIVAVTLAPVVLVSAFVIVFFLSSKPPLKPWPLFMALSAMSGLD